ncbi:MAG: LpxI family protein [Alphaproteobacteria bacterium]
MSPSPARLAIIAGGGELPMEIARAAMAAGRDVFLLAVEEFADPAPAGIDSERKSIGKLGWCIRRLRERQCTEVVFAGHFKRPRDGNIRMRPDLGGIWFLVSNFGVLRRHNDGIHRAIASTFERAGFRVLSPLQAAPTLAASPGYLTLSRGAPALERDFRLALEAARQHGASGQGQAIIYANGRTVAAETKAGTEAMLKGVDPQAARGGLLVKSMAPGQLVSMDPPAIGCHTVELAAAAGLAGILVEAGHSVIVQPQAVKAAADAAGLFGYGMCEP